MDYVRPDCSLSAAMRAPVDPRGRFAPARTGAGLADPGRRAAPRAVDRVSGGRTAIAAMIFLTVGSQAVAAEPGPASHEPAPRTVEAFMSGFRELKGFEARFVETKTMALLSVPLRTEGRLYFSSPAALLRVVERPQPARVLVTPTTVTMRAGGQTQRVDLASQPEARSLVSSLLSLLSGDLKALKKTYQVAYETGPDGRWSLVLNPRNERVAALVEQMRFDGVGRSVERITIDEASGDRAVTEIRDAKPGRRYSPEERARLFTSP